MRQKVKERNTLTPLPYNGYQHASADRCGCGKRAVVGLWGTDKNGRKTMFPRCAEHAVPPEKREQKRPEKRRVNIYRPKIV